MDLTALSLFAFALAVTAGSPGPSIAALVARVIARGWRDVMPFLGAMWLGEVLWLTAAVTGLSALAERFQAGFVILKALGVLYLAYLAWQMWRAPVAGEDAPLPQRSSAWGMFWAGMAVTLGNPKIMVFYLALLPALVDLNAMSPGIWAALVCVALATLAVIDLTWVFMAHRARRFLTTPRAVRTTNRLSAVTLGGVAALIATR